MLKTTTSIINASQIAGVLPVLNGGTGVTTSTGTGSTVLSAAPTLSGNVTLSTGNLIVASGQGIDFSATPGTGTSELLADYEEGTWTPNQGAAVTVVGAFSSSGTYTKVGRLVTIVGTMSGATSIAVGAPNIITSNLPFTAADNTPAGITAGVSSGGSAIVIGTSTQLYSVTTFVASGSAIIFSATYFV
jgi:hypothetical protein